jgi:hypothetical protein
MQGYFRVILDVVSRYAEECNAASFIVGKRSRDFQVNTASLIARRRSPIIRASTRAPAALTLVLAA